MPLMVMDVSAMFVATTTYITQYQIYYIANLVFTLPLSQTTLLLAYVETHIICDTI